MRLTNCLCALVVFLALSATAQQPIVTQVPAPKAESPPAPVQEDPRLREALRKALEAQPDSPAPSNHSLNLGTPITAPAITLTLSDTNIAAYLASTNMTAVSLSLEESIRLALENNLDLQVNRYNPIISEYDRRSFYGYYDPTFTSGLQRQNQTSEGGGFNSATGGELPQVKTETDTARFGLSGWLPTGMRYELSHSVYEINASRPRQVGTNMNGQPIFITEKSDSFNSFGTLLLTQPLLRNSWIDAPRLQIKLSRINLRSSELTFESQVMAVINTVEQAYYQLIAQNELVRVAESDVAVKKQLFEEQHRRVEVGTLAPLDEKLAQADFAQSQILLIYARNAAVSAENTFKALIHDNFLAQLRVQLDLTDKLLSVPPQLDMFDALKTAVEKRPDLQNARLNLERQQIQLKFDFNQLFPSLDLFGSYGLNGLDPTFSGVYNDIARTRNPQTTYGLALSFPLSMWKERNNYKASQAAKAQLIVAFKQLEQAIEHDVEMQVRLLRTYWEAIPLTREQTAYQRQALEAEQKKLAVGKSTSFEVLRIASELTRAQATEVTTLRDYNQAKAQLAFLNGTTLERWRIDAPANVPMRSPMTWPSNSKVGPMH